MGPKTSVKMKARSLASAAYDWTSEGTGRRVRNAG